jgi:hypothetical protein
MTHIKDILYQGDDYEKIKNGLVILHGSLDEIDDIYDWLAEHEMRFKFLNASSTYGEQWTSWYIPDDADRIMFILRWSN